MTRTKEKPTKTRTAKLPNRAMLIAYLQYALDELKKVDQASAVLVDAAIGNLRKAKPAGR